MFQGGKKVLTNKELLEIKELQEVCEKEGGFQLKLNFDMLKNRVGDRDEDFFHYEDGRLVGFLGSYGFGDKVELCGMVHPDFRRRRIFSKLIEKGLEETKKQNIKTILLNAPTGSITAKEFLKKIPCQFSIAEYQMQWQETELSVDPTVIVRPSISKDDWKAEIQLEVSGFGMTEKEAGDYNQYIRDSGGDQNLIIEKEGKIVGKMRVSESNDEAWIYGFTIFPELRGQGIGRKALTNVVKMQQRKGLPVFLEVEAKNAHALGLYESCGFRTYHSQDYYKFLG